MRLTLTNFGKFENFEFEFFPANTYENGFGKTTMINAYIWVLSGKTINGFVPRRVGTSDETPVAVTLHLAEGFDITRKSTNRGTAIYVRDSSGEREFTQKELDQYFDVPLRVACANPLVLTDPSLTSAQLRTFLTNTGCMDNGEGEELRKRQTTLRAELKTAEQHALVSVKVPEHTVDPLTPAEVGFLQMYAKCAARAKNEPTRECPTCGQTLPEEDYANAMADYRLAVEYVNDVRLMYDDVRSRQIAYEGEEHDIEHAKALIATARLARERVTELQKELDDIEERLRVVDAQAVCESLPDGVQVETSKTAKTTGATSSVCTLTYHGVPLKSVNQAERVRICVRILDSARKRQRAIHIPIIVDAALEVAGIIDYVDNIIAFYVEQVWSK